MVNYYKNGLVMITLKMSTEDSKLLTSVIMDYTTQHRPIRYGGDFTNNPKLTDEEWLRLTDLLNVLHNNKK